MEEAHATELLLKCHFSGIVQKLAIVTISEVITDCISFKCCTPVQLHVQAKTTLDNRKIFILQSTMKKESENKKKS